MKRYRTLKNFVVDTIPHHLTEASQVAAFLGITMNALYLRLHFDNFPRPVKLNGKLWFDMKELIPHLQQSDEETSYAWLVRDEIRTLIDTGLLDRRRLGELADMPRPAVFGGGIYLRPIGSERARTLGSLLLRAGYILYLPNPPYAPAAAERSRAALEVWEELTTRHAAGRLAEEKIGAMLGHRRRGKAVGRAILQHGPSWRVARMLRLAMLKSDLR